MGDDDSWEPAPSYLTVDLVILTIQQGRLCVLAIERGIDPYRGRRALPGGFVGGAEPLDDAAVRELREEAGLDATTFHIEQLHTYGAPARDPRGRVVTVAYLALVPNLPAPTAGTDARAAEWLPVDVVTAGELPLAFDHGEILRDGLARARSKLEYTPLAASFCDEEFTISELRHVYEAVWGARLDPRNFHRKVTRTEGFLIGTGRRTTRDGGRPAELFRRGTAELLHPPMLMPRRAELRRPAGPTGARRPGATSDR